jgi:hypothetical protein
MIYRLYSTNILESQNVNAAMTVGQNPEISFIFAPQNSDYQNFKKQINADEAQLQDAEGVIMTDAKAYVATLP